MSLHAHFRWGVSFVGEFSTEHFSPRREEIFSGTGATREKIENTDPRTQL